MKMPLPWKHAWLLATLALTIGFLPMAASSDEALTITVVVSLTGAAAFTGADEKNVLQVYESVINKEGGVRGRPVHFQFLDDTSSPQVAVQLVNGIAANHGAVFLGPSLTGPCAAGEAIVRSAGPVEYCFSPGLQTPKGGFAFSAARSIDAMLFAEERFMNEKGYHRVALVATTDASGQFGSSAVINELKNYPALQLVDDERFAQSSLTISAEIAKLKAANPQVVYVIAIGPAFGTVLRGLHDAGLDIPVFGTSGNLNDQLAQFASFLPKELYFDGDLYQGSNSEGSAAIKKAGAAYLGALKAAGLTPSPSTACAWDAASIVLSAFRQLGADATAEQVHAYIENLHDFSGVNGLYDFRPGDQHGLGPDSLIVVKWSPSTETVSAASQPGGMPL